MPSVVKLQPPLTTPQTLSKFNEGVSALSVTLSPRANEIAIHTQLRREPPKNYKSDPQQHPNQHTIWLANYDGTRDSTHLLYREAYLTFKAFQHLSAEQRFNGVQPDSIENLEFCYRFLDTYMNNLSAHVDRLSGEEPVDVNLYNHYESLSASTHLFQAIFTPARGIQRAVVGEELLDWVNASFVAPTTGEGAALANLEEPWLSDGFWPYVTRCILRGLCSVALHFFQRLSPHPSPTLRHIIALMPQVLNSLPRSTNYATEHEFFTAHRRWQGSVRKLRAELNLLEDDDGEGEWRNGLEEIVSILEGKKDTVIRLCEQDSGGYGWREALATWGVWVDVELRRDDLPDLLGLVLESLPLDSTIIAEALQAAIVLGDTSRTIRLASDLDIWLGAHIADVLSKLGHDVDSSGRAIVDKEQVADDDEENPTSRDILMMDFAGRLHSDPTLWAVELDYLATCGRQGRGRMGEMMRRLAVDVDDKMDDINAVEQKANGIFSQQASDMFLDERLGVEEEEPSDKLGKLTGMQRVERLVELCKEYEMLDEMESLCRVVAQILVRKRRYGDAVPYCICGRDMKSLGRIADLLLDEYVNNGPSEFISLVDELPTPAAVQIQLHHLGSPLTGATSTVFLTRMQFTTEYATFHKLFQEGKREQAATQLITMLNSGIVPRGWWGVLLLDAGGMLEDEELWYSDQDAYDLLKYLEEIYIRAEQGCGSDYLGALEMMMKKTKKDKSASQVASDDAAVIKQLEVVRLALARYLARSFTIRGGKSS